MRKPSNITIVALATISLSFIVGLGWSFLRNQDLETILTALDGFVGPVVLILIFFKVFAFVTGLR